MKKANGRRRKLNPLKVVFAILIALLLFFTSVFGVYVVKSGGNVSTAIKSMLKDVVGDQDPIFILVMGISEDISVDLTDTIMLIGYNPDTNQAFVLSIPRDTFVGTNEAKAGGYDKINALYQKNPQKTIDAVEKITGINIDYYVTVRTSVLVKIVDTIGGVEFDVPINMNYDDPTQNLHIHLKAGNQKINGKQAEQLVRFRHNNNGTTYSYAYGDNDQGRTRTQREFVKVLAQKVLSTRNVDQIKQILSDVFDNLETNVTLEKAFCYIPYAIDLKIDELEMEQLPGTTKIMNSLWFFKTDVAKTEELIQSYIDKLGLTDKEKQKYLKNYSVEDNKNSVNNKSTAGTENEKSNFTNSTNKTSSVNEKENIKEKNNIIYKTKNIINKDGES